jgi:hypothetical protein
MPFTASRVCLIRSDFAKTLLARPIADDRAETYFGRDSRFRP